MFGKFQKAFWDSREVLIIIIFINHRLITDLFKQRQIENSFNSLFPLLSFLLTSVSSSSLHYHILHSLQSYLSSSSTVPSILLFYLFLDITSTFLSFFSFLSFYWLFLSIHSSFQANESIFIPSIPWNQISDSLSLSLLYSFIDSSSYSFYWLIYQLLTSFSLFIITHFLFLLFSQLFLSSSLSSLSSFHSLFSSFSYSPSSSSYPTSSFLLQYFSLQLSKIHCFFSSSLSFQIIPCFLFFLFLSFIDWLLFLFFIHSGGVSFADETPIYLSWTSKRSVLFRIVPKSAIPNNQLFSVQSRNQSWFYSNYSFLFLLFI